MEKERIEKHIEFLKSEYKKIVGQTRVSNKGKNAKIRKEADGNLSDACVRADHYLCNNKDLFDFMVETANCAPEYLEYPESQHIEKDTKYYLDWLKIKLSESQKG